MFEQCAVKSVWCSWHDEHYGVICRELQQSSRGMSQMAIITANEKSCLTPEERFSVEYDFYGH